jgi:hypothetical protein
MQNLSQRLFAGIAAVLGFGGMASAQSSPPGAYPAIPIPPAQVVQKVPFEPVLPATVQSVPFQPILPVQSIAVVQQPASPAVPSAAIPTSIGCTSCNDCNNRTGAKPYLPKNTMFGAGLAPVPYAEYCAQCANGCGSLKSNIGFYLGSSKSFFNPCGPIPCNIWGTPSVCHKCGVFPYGKPYGTGFNTCNYDSNLNH